MNNVKINNYMFYVAFVASLGGFLFGFDTAGISGAEAAIQEVYGLTDYWHGFTIAIALIGTIIGTVVCGKPVERYGRKLVLQWVGGVYLVSALGCGLIVDWYSFLFFRLIGGIAVGASSVVGPMYIAEISPAHWRGRFVAFFQFNIVFGIVAAYVSNYYLAGIPDDWRWMLGVLAIPSLVFVILLFTIPESPRWLVKKQRGAEAERVFTKIGTGDITAQLTAVKASFQSSLNDERLFQRKYYKPIVFAFLIATFNQLSGINAILYYAPRIFETAGLLRDSALMQSAIIGVTNLVFTMLAMLIIDRVGRKKLLVVGSVGMIVSLGLAAKGFYEDSLEGYAMLFYLVGFIASFAISLGAVIWVLIAEVFPTSVRAKGQVLGSMTHWVWNTALSWTFPIIVGSIGNGAAYIFGFFALAMVATLFFAWFVLPETKNKSLEQLQEELTT